VYVYANFELLYVIVSSPYLLALHGADDVAGGTGEA